MNAIALPVPLDAWDTFRVDVEHFCETWRQFPPGADCTLFAMCCGFDPDSEVKKVFEGLPVEYARYDGQGKDIGAHQHLAFQIGEAFQISMSTRTFFHREGWLAKILESRNYFGPGLFGTAVSRETGILHFRTHCYAMEAGYFRRYPQLINSKNQTFAFEHGAFNNPVGSLLNWAKAQGDMAVACVYWDGGWRETEWFDRPEIFRTGKQENLLVFDRHTALFSQYSYEEQNSWRDKAFTDGLPKPEPPKAAHCCGGKSA
jgi:hypothetical protein